jgi:hypothetical protein
MKTHSDPLSPPRRHAPCPLATQLPSAYHRTHFGPQGPLFLDRLDRLDRVLSRFQSTEGGHTSTQYPQPKILICVECRRE